jgi:hypothetical protein
MATVVRKHHTIGKTNPSTGLNVTHRCDNATATVVFKSIDAVNDGPTTIASATTPVTVQNVTSNDRLNACLLQLQ